MDINKRRFRRRSVLGAPASPGARASPFPSRMMGLRAALLASASRPRLARVPGSAFGSVTRRRLGAPPRRARVPAAPAPPGPIPPPGPAAPRARLAPTVASALSGFGSAPLSPSRLAPDGTFPVGPDTVILGIETSCDDTGAAVVTGDGRVLGEALTSQEAIHGPWGGVVPNLARAAHEDAIDRVVADALERAGVTPADLTAVAVTVGPGLSMCLRVGVVKARSIAAAHRLPIVPVHHMEAHALIARLSAGTAACAFPFLALLVSGGHNQLILAKGVGEYVILGSTLDDALGEAYDKIARLLGLDVGGGGGPALERLAESGDPKAYRFPVPLRKRKNCDFSYAGLKTAVRMAIERDLGRGDPEGEEGKKTRAFSTVCAPEGPPPPSVAAEPTTVAPGSTRDQIRADIAASFQSAAVKHLEERTRRAIEWADDRLREDREEEEVGDDATRGGDADGDASDSRRARDRVTCVVVAGGVAANATVRERLAAIAEDAGLPLILPPPRWCTDNGAMAAWAGAERLALGLAEEPPEAISAEAGSEGRRGDGDVPLMPRWPLGEKDARATGETKSSKKARVAAPLSSGGAAEGRGGARGRRTSAVDARGTGGA